VIRRARRCLAAALGAIGLLTGCGGSSAPTDNRLPDDRITMGAAVKGFRLDDDAYAKAVIDRFWSITPQREMKWRATEPQRGRFEFAAADRIVDFAEEHDLTVRGHTLVWHGGTPAWVTGDLATMREHIAGVVGHFRGRVGEWDVVNEALAGDGQFRRNVWFKANGPGYIPEAFRAARAADPKARLVYNDFDAEAAYTPKGQALYRLIKGLVDLKVPIDAVGFQTHVTAVPIPGFPTQLARVAALGVDVELTEVDVRLPDDAPPGALVRQAAAYQRIVEACVAVPRCHSITTWGVGDGDSWVPGAFPGFGRALLLDEQLRPKPAYEAVRLALQPALQ
jgi:endo-1,4-beta-xylanase